MSNKELIENAKMLADPKSSFDIPRVAKVTLQRMLVALEAPESPTTPVAGEPRFEEMVQAERSRQIEKGYTSEHDDEQGMDHLLHWALHFLKQGEAVKGAALIEAAREAAYRATTVEWGVRVVGGLTISVNKVLNEDEARRWVTECAENENRFSREAVRRTAAGPWEVAS